MKKMILWSALCLCAFGAGGELQAQVSSAKTKKGVTASQLSKENLFRLASEAIKSQNFVLELHDPKSTSKTEICYNFMEVNGDKILLQLVSAPDKTRNSSSTGGSFLQAEGTLTTYELTPDKKGNLMLRIVADMHHLERAGRSTFVFKRTLKLFKNTNQMPWGSDFQGTVVLPNQSNIVKLNGSMGPQIPVGFSR